MRWLTRILLVLKRHERGRPEAPDQEPGQRAKEHENRKQRTEQHRDTGDHRDGERPAGLDDLAAHPDPRRDHERDDGAAQCSDDARHDPGFTKRHVDPRQRDDQHEAGEDEQPAARDRAAHPVQAVPEVTRELLRLRAGQRGAQAQGVEERALVDPLAALHDLAVHQIDLRERAAKRDAAESQPDAQRRPERRGHVVAPPIAHVPRRVRAPPSTKRIRMNSVMPTQRPVRPQPR